jgi:hypothetical protein
MNMTKPDWIKPKAIISNGVWVGVINDVYESATTGKVVLELRWVKNSYQHTPYELIALDRLAGTLRPATVEELKAESLKFRDKAAQDAQQLIEMVS